MGDSSPVPSRATAPRVSAYVARYAPKGTRVRGKKAEFLDYSWKLNVVR